MKCEEEKHGKESSRNTENDEKKSKDGINSRKYYTYRQVVVGGMSLSFTTSIDWEFVSVAETSLILIMGLGMQ